jgi:hypothetical protein
VKGAQLLKGNGKVGIRLYIRPEKFGAIDVRLIMDEKKRIHIEFIIDAPETAALIKASLTILRTNLERVDVSLAGIDVRTREEEKEGIEGMRIRPIELDVLASKVNYVA